MHDQAGHFGHAILQVGDHGHAAIDHSVVFQYGEVFDVALNHAAPPRNQGAVRLYRFNELNNRADIVDHGGTQVFQRVFHHHGAHPVVCEDFQQHRTVQ